MDDLRDLHYYALYGRVIELFTLLLIFNQTLLVLDRVAFLKISAIPQFRNECLLLPNSLLLAITSFRHKVQLPRRRSECRRSMGLSGG